MKIREVINEAFSDKYIVLVNPTRKELFKVAKDRDISSFKYVVDKKGNVYAASGAGMTHSSIQKKIIREMGEMEFVHKGYLNVHEGRTEASSSINSASLKKVENNENVKRILKK